MISYSEKSWINFYHLGILFFLKIAILFNGNPAKLLEFSSSQPASSFNKRCSKPDQQQLQCQMSKQGCAAMLQEHAASCRQEPAVKTEPAQGEKTAKRGIARCGLWESSQSKVPCFAKQPILKHVKSLMEICRCLVPAWEQEVCPSTVGSVQAHFEFSQNVCVRNMVTLSLPMAAPSSAS